MFESSSNRLLLEFNCCDPWTEFTPPPDEADETFAEANAPKSPRMVDGIISESFVPCILGSMSIILGLIILIKVIKLQNLIWFIHNIFIAILIDFVTSCIKKQGLFSPSWIKLYNYCSTIISPCLLGTH